MKIKVRVILALVLAGHGSMHEASGQKVSQHVDPFIGTGGHGHTYPGATLPFGLVQLSPDNGTQGWDWCSGYNYADSNIVGFSHTHLSGTGIGDLADISVMPSLNKKPDTLPTPSSFLHSQETARPGYYQVLLKDFNINVELTTGKFYGFHRYTFKQAGPAMVKLNLGFAINWDKPTECSYWMVNDSTMAGWRFSTGWAKNQKVFYAIRFNKRLPKPTAFVNNMVGNLPKGTGQTAMVCWNFDAKANEQLLMKVGISFGDVQGAIDALSEYEGWNFNAAVQQAADVWEQELGKIKIATKDATVLKTFYTALYHTYQAPARYSDIRGNYTGAKGALAHSDAPVFSVHSLWDTFRAANPLLTLTQPALVPHLINSYLQFYQQYGLLPVWDLMFNETNTMTGYHAVPIVADAILKNLPGFDYSTAYNAMKASAMQTVRATDAYRQFGYVPQDKHGWSVTMTLEYAYDDWCIAQVAKKLGFAEDAAIFEARAAGYKLLFDKQSGFFRAKNSDGKWVEPFDPYYSEHGFEGMYIEGTAWQHTFFVPHAVDAYANLLGGKAALIRKLDTLFTTTSRMNGENVSNDISGLIGQYAHGNEPSHHIAYLYAALGAPQKTAQRVRQILTTMYSAKPDGLSGNEDCGQMSAWYVWSALGLYPMNPSSGEYVFGSPLINQASIALPNGKTLRIEVKNNNGKNITVRKATLNGKPITQHFITHRQLLQGGTLLLQMAP
ncbi:MAG: glycoside hydrolase family 92 protein [Bacteroidetes bacterium]|nr:MAG: glycoside hydrolase family 92 protein [Bacteroidota bacterium]